MRNNPYPIHYVIKDHPLLFYMLQAVTINVTTGKKKLKNEMIMNNVFKIRKLQMRFVVELIYRNISWEISFVKFTSIINVYFG